MRKVYIIAKREYLAAVRSKAFIMSLVFMPLMMFGSMGIQVLMAKQVDTREKQYAVVDRSPGATVASVLLEAAKVRNEKERFDTKTKEPLGPPFVIKVVKPSDANPEAVQKQRLELCDKVRSGAYDGFLEIGSKTVDASTDAHSISSLAKVAQPEKLDDAFVIRYQTSKPADTDFRQWAEPVVNLVVQQERFAKAKLPWVQVSTLMQHVPLVLKGMTIRNTSDGTVADAPEHAVVAPLIIPLILLVLMFMVVMVGSSPLVQSVIEEKMQRVAEVLLGSLTPFELMLGKLIGMTCVSLTVVGIYLLGGWITAWKYGMSEYLQPTLMAWFVFYQVLAIFMFGSIFAAVGAACTDVKETQAMLTPIMFIVTLPLLMIAPILKDPNSSFVTILSMIPFTAPMLMMTRQAIPPGVPAWQPFVAVAGVILTTLLCVYIGGRIFRVGLLMQGKAPRMSELVKWVLKA